MTKHAIKLMAAVLLSAAGPLTAQDTARAHQAVFDQVVVAGQHGTLSIRASAGQPATARWISDGRAITTISAAMPFDLVGNFVALSETQYLVSGRESATGDGRLVRIELDFPNSAIVVRESITLPGVDPYAIDWMPSVPVLLMVDVVSHSLLYLPWAGPSADPSLSVLPNPLTLTVAVTGNQCPPLDFDMPTLSNDDTAFTVGRFHMEGSWTVSLTGNGWQVTAPLGSSPGNYWGVDVSAGHAQPMRVMSSATALGANNSFQVIGPSGSAVGSGTIAAVNAWTSIGPLSPFYEWPGSAFKVTGPLSQDSDTFFPLLRYGQSAGDSVLTLRASSLSPLSLYVGSPMAYFWVPTKVPSASITAPVPFQGYCLLGVGFRGAGAPPDPVVGTGQNARLQYSSAATVTQNQLWTAGGVGYGMPVPADTGIDGLVILSQWAFFSPSDPNSLIYSDICGSRIGPARQAALGAITPSTSSSQLGSSSNATSLASRRLCLDRWLQSAPHMLQPSSAELVHLRQLTGQQ
jgi:hypothetical protein